MDHALGGVHDDADRCQQVHEVHLARGKDGSADVTLNWW